MPHTLHTIALPLTTSPDKINTLIYRALGYRQFRDIPKEEYCTLAACHELLWYWPNTQGGSRSWAPANPLTYTDSVERALTLPFPSREGRSESWIHLELGEQSRWILRLRKYAPAGTSSPIPPKWDSTDLYVLDSDEYPNLSLPLAYCHVWLASRSLILREQREWPVAI